MKITAAALLSASFFCSFAQAGVNALHIGERQLQLNGQRVSEANFQDESGRDVYLRGWNVSGSVKLTSQGFKPFLNSTDAARSFETMKRYTGANFVRFTIAWEGTHPAPDQIDYAYLDEVISQLREAFKQKIYVFLDFHTDLFSRYLFDETSQYTGNGAPEWIVKGGHYPAANCITPCFVWGQSLIANPAVRLAYRNFFDNASIQTSAGQRYVQDEFVWQLQQVLSYLTRQLSAEEFDWLLGVEPINEPLYGEGHIDTAAFFDNQKLWPFYQRVRAVLNEQGWQNKWVFAEPSLFWNTNAGFFLKPTGGHYLKQPPGPGFVFAPHFYDAARLGVTNFNRVLNGEYLSNLDLVRDEANYLGLPAMLGEFGMWLKDQNGGSRDYARILHGMYQALEASDNTRQEKDRRLNFHTPLVASTQWHWDIYKDQRHEYQNGNLHKLKTRGDGWNSEDFSAVKNEQLTVNQQVVARAYPRAVDGNIVSFYYNDLALDGAGKSLDWAEIRTASASYFADKQFALLIWQGGSGRQTELFLPPGFDPAKSLLISDVGVQPIDTLVKPEFESGVSGYALQFSAPATTEQTFHFALVVNSPAQSGDALATLQQQLVELINRQENPVFLRGQMMGLNYPPENAEPERVRLTASEEHFLFLRRVKLSWQAEQPVQILKNGAPIKQAGAEGRFSVLTRVGKQERLQICEMARPQYCSRILQLD